MLQAEVKLGDVPGAGTPEDMPRATPANEPPVFDRAGWKAIAGQVGMSRRFAYDAAHRPVDPMPVFKLGRTVMASSSALNEWIRRQSRPMSPLALDAAAQGSSLRLVAAAG